MNPIVEITLYLAGIVVLLSFLFFYLVFNARETAHQLGADAQVARGKRRSLIAKLVGIADAYAQHERDVFKGVAGTSDASVTATLAFITATSQRFPELKADRSFTSLMDQLTVVEAELQGKLEKYNNAVMVFNSHPFRRILLKFSGRLGLAALTYETTFDEGVLDNNTSKKQ